MHIIRLISEGTVEEGIYRIASEKLESEQKIASSASIYDTLVGDHLGTDEKTSATNVSCNDGDDANTPLHVLNIWDRPDEEKSDAVSEQQKPSDEHSWSLLLDALNSN